MVFLVCCVNGTVCPGLDGLAVHSRVNRKSAIQEGGGATVHQVIATREAIWQLRIGGKAIALANQGGMAEGTKGDVAERTASLLTIEGL
ncbi:UNVERIFIED_CONTAM: hypothetical protein FKN15_004143 [Acipenser sinensis]